MSAGSPASVLVILHESGLGGASVSLLRALPRLRERGWEFSFWVDNPSALSDHLHARGYEVAGVPRSIGFDFSWLRRAPGPAANLRALPGYLRALRAHVGERAPALVHANSVYSLPDALVASRRAPTLLHSHEMIPSAGKALTARLLARAAGLTVAGASGACAARLGPRARVVHSSAPEPGPVAPDRPPRQPPVVGTLGYVCRRKGTDLFTAAAAICRADGADAVFRIVGDPMESEEEWARAALADAGANGVEHEPYTSAADPVTQFDLLVHPARSDTFPLAVLEAMLAGVPVIATDVGGVAEALGEAGVLVAPEDPAALATAIGRLLADPRERERLAREARERVLGNFTPSCQAAALDRIYREMLGGGGPSGG